MQCVSDYLSDVLDYLEEISPYGERADLNHRTRQRRATHVNEVSIHLNLMAPHKHRPIFDT